jgi:hypothetical protein
VEAQYPVGRWRIDLATFVAHRGGDPRRLHRDLLLVDVRVAARRVGKHEPDERRPDHEPHDEQPPVEFGVHERVPSAPTRGEAVEGGRFIRRPV